VTDRPSPPSEPDALRVAVNLLWCVPGAVGGSEQYLVRQLSGLQAQLRNGAPGSRHGVHSTVFASAAFHRSHHDELVGCHLVEAPGSGERRWQRIIQESTWLHSRTKGFDLVHHGGGTAPTIANKPFVLTVHDLQYRTFPEYFSRLKRMYLDAVMPRSARRAAVVTVPSEYVRSTVVNQFDIDPAKVVVVPHGYEPALLHERTPEADLRARYALGDGPVLVFPAMTAPHKNHRFLIELMRTAWTDPALRLVFIGGRGTADGDVTEAIRAAGPSVAQRIIRPGRVPDADRNGLLSMATALVFPSQYEGFGAPLIEAMALGAPVICSDATCLPEVAGGAAIVLPLELEAWAYAIDAVAVARETLVAAGRERVAAFTSLRSGEALMAAYEQAVA
jgi:glycosyltransferase involved in cell wall biosynthesis